MTRPPASFRLGGLFGLRPVLEPGLLSGGAASSPSLGRESIRLLTWNVHKQTDPRWHADFDRILDQHRPDIVHLQEARLDAMLAAFSRRAEAWTWMASPNLSLSPAAVAAAVSGAPAVGAPPASGVASRVAVGALTAARAPLQRGMAMLSKTAEPLLGTRKPMLRCGLPVRESADGVLCLNIHALNFSLGLAGYGAQLDALLEAAAAHRGPVLLSGDFNTWSRRRMDLLLRKMDAAGLRRVEFESEGPRRRWMPFQALDHVFHSHGDSGLKPASALRLDSIRSSDHAPLLVDFAP